MAQTNRRSLRRLTSNTKRAGNAVVGALALGFIKLFRLADPDRTAGLLAAIMRCVGPWLPEHRIGRANLAAAYPEKSPNEIETILRGAWDNLGRVAAEFIHLDRIWQYNAENSSADDRIQIGPEAIERFARLKDDGKPALIFTAHTANWELPAVAATLYGLDSAALYRRPNVPAIDRWVRGVRASIMGELIPTTFDGALKAAEALKAGKHVGMLVDQHFGPGIEVEFFGRPCLVNPLLARLARHFDCPIHGVHTVRLPGRKFRVELTDEIAPVRDGDGRVDVTATMQAITNVVEGWVREHPEQWLWLHRRWRPRNKVSGRS